MKLTNLKKKYPGKNLFWGTFFSLLMAGILLYLDTTKYHIPSSPGMFATLIIFIAFHFGLSAGMSAALVGWLFTAIHFSSHEGLFTYNKADFIRVVMWGFIMPLQGIMIGLLKDRLLKKVNSEKILQQKLVAASKMVATGEMAAGIAHEINTPLATMVLCAEMITMENDSLPLPNKEIAKHASAISDTGLRISKIIEGLKGFARDASQDKDQIFSVRDLVSSTLELCNERFKNHAINVIIKEDHLDTLIDGQIIQLSQTVLNLLNNSFDAIYELSERWIQVEVTVTKGHLNLSITDSGAGISKEVVEKIFLPFFTTKDVGKGTGLGLSISANIIQDHGGSLIYDDKSKNTCFIIRLPVAQARI